MPENSGLSLFSKRGERLDSILRLQGPLVAGSFVVESVGEGCARGMIDRVEGRRERDRSATCERFREREGEVQRGLAFRRDMVCKAEVEGFLGADAFGEEDELLAFAGPTI